MPATKTSAVIKRLVELNQKFDDINHPNKLDAFSLKFSTTVFSCLTRFQPISELADSLKQSKELTSSARIANLFLSECLHMTSKNVVRKLIMKCINSLTRLPGFSKLNEQNLVRQTLVGFLTDDKRDLSNKLFILTIYIENLEKYGSFSRSILLMI